MAGVSGLVWRRGKSRDRSTTTSLVCLKLRIKHLHNEFGVSGDINGQVYCVCQMRSNMKGKSFICSFQPLLAIPAAS